MNLDPSAVASLRPRRGPTALIELGDWRLPTDPTFDPAGEHDSFGRGTGSVKTTAPAIAAGEPYPTRAARITRFR